MLFVFLFVCFFNHQNTSSITFAIHDHPWAPHPVHFHFSHVNSKKKIKNHWLIDRLLQPLKVCSVWVWCGVDGHSLNIQHMSYFFVSKKFKSGQLPTKGREGWTRTGCARVYAWSKQAIRCCAGNEVTWVFRLPSGRCVGRAPVCVRIILLLNT